jgi:hypothetical protein
MSITYFEKEDRPTFDDEEPLVRSLMLIAGTSFLASGGKHHDGRLGSRIGD